MDSKTIFSALVPNAQATAMEAIAATLERFGEGALRCAVDGGVTVRVLEPQETYTSASPELRKLRIDVDAWPQPAAGLFVVFEKTVYLRSCSPLTVSHEFGHALDACLGGGVYRSGVDPEIRAAFATARSFLTPYSATGIDEYFAEACRAWVGVNDENSSWPNVSRERLLRVDPAMFEIVSAIFARFAAS